MTNARRTSTLTGLTMAAAAVVAGLSLLAAPAFAEGGSSVGRHDGAGMSSMNGGSSADNLGMQRMHELMQQGNPGMRMHELMQQGNPGMRRMHASMTDQAR